jgi:hypothetical protein
MALHDQGANELCAAEPVHKLAWILDAAHKARAAVTLMRGSDVGVLEGSVFKSARICDSWVLHGEDAMQCRQ